MLEEAAAQSLPEGGAEGFSPDCLELALRYCDDPSKRAALEMKLTRLLWHRRPSATAGHLTALGDALRTGSLNRRQAIPVVTYLLWLGRNREALDTLQWLAENDVADDPQLVLGARRLRSLVEPASWGDLADSIPDLSPSEDDVDGETLCESLGATTALAVALHGGCPMKAAELAQQALANEKLDDTLSAVEAALFALFYAGRPDLGDAWCRHFIVRAQMLGSKTWEAQLQSMHALAALRGGDLTSAEQGALRALELISPHDWGTHIGFPLAILLRALTGLGRYEEAERSLRHYVVPESAYRSRAGLLYLRARGHFFVATCRLYAAWEDFNHCRQVATELSLDLPVLAPWRSDVAHVHISLGRLAEARALVLEQLQMPGGDNPRTRGISLHALAMTETPPERLALLQEAVELLQSAGDVPELLLALVDLCATHRRLGEDDAVHLIEHKILELAAESGLEERYRELLGIRDSLHAVPDSEGEGEIPFTLLSEAELRVAKLAAQGHSNRQISRQLYITVSTVEQHLTRTYRKLSISGREDLPGASGFLEAQDASAVVPVCCSSGVGSLIAAMAGEPS